MNQEFEINQLAELIVNNALQANRVRNLTNVGVIGNTKRPRLYSEFGYPKNSHSVTFSKHIKECRLVERQ